jgi:uncharacterized RDD family membrane protein YckC
MAAVTAGAPAAADTGGGTAAPAPSIGSDMAAGPPATEPDAAGTAAPPATVSAPIPAATAAVPAAVSAPMTAATAAVPAAPSAPITAATAAVPAAPFAPRVRPAGFWIRVPALLVDLVCVMLAEVLFGFLLLTLAEDRLARAASHAFRVLASPCYFVFLHWARGQTLGKMAFRIRVVSLDGGALSLGQAVLRHLGSWLSLVLLGIGYLLAAFRADKRALHDLIARTRVEHVT